MIQSKDLAKLEALRLCNDNKGWVNKRLYRMMYIKDLYIVAYERIKSKPGNMTPGPDGSTLDEFSLKTIENIIGKMKDESFEFSRARRVHIEKAKGGTRPLGIAPPKDKIVQEVLRMVLEAIYDSPHGPSFSDNSHGFRVGRGCHTVLKQVRLDWTGVNWIIEGDIKSFFDTIDHDLLIEILRKRIADERFLNLIRKSLKAGYLEFNVPVDSDFGTPQGSILSPILANIFLHEFDEYMEELKKREEKGQGKKQNPVYRNICYQISRTQELIAVSGGDNREALVRKLQELKIQKMRTPSLDPLDDNFIRIKYVRYADDWMVGVNGPKQLAIDIRDELSKFLDGLKLSLSMEKTHIRHAKSEEAFFLGTRIKIGQQGQGKVTQTTAKKRP